MISHFAPLLLLALLAGCSSNAPGDSMATDQEAEVPPIQSETPAMVDLAGTSWRLEDLAGAGVLDRVPSTLEFGPDGQISGSGGCNRFSGSYQRHGDTLSLGPLAATRMACPEAVMHQEMAFLAVLESVAWYEWTAEDFLVLHPADEGAPTRLVAIGSDKPPGGFHPD